jgi:hypothetical protein
MVFHILKNSFVTKGSEFFCTRSSLLESVAVTEFQATEAYSNLDLTEAKNSNNNNNNKVILIVILIKIITDFMTVFPEIF